MADYEKKTYVPKSSAKLIETRNGTTILKLGFHAESLIAFLREHANERGYINLCVTARREVGERGDTHCVWLDTWKPTRRENAPEPEHKGTNGAYDVTDDTIPF